MSALFRNSSFFQHNNPVGISDRFEAVSDNDYRPPRNQGIDSLLHFYFILRIERGGSLIQQHDRSFFQHGTGNGDPLFFSSRKSAATFSYHRIVSFGQTHDEFVTTSLFRCHYNLFIRSICPAETDIILQRILKQIDILKNHGTMFH